MPGLQHRYLKLQYYGRVTLSIEQGYSYTHQYVMWGAYMGKVKRGGGQWIQMNGALYYYLNLAKYII